MNDLFDSGSKEGPHQVEAVLDQWYDPEGVFYKIRADDGNIYILRQQTSTPEGIWDVVSCFVGAQLIGAAGATTLFRWLVPALPVVAPDILVRHANAESSGR